MKKILNLKSLISNLLKKLFFWKGILRRNPRASAIFLILLALFSSMYIWTATRPRKSEAAWFNTNWSYRAAINISAHTSLENNVYLNLTGTDDLDTSDTTKFQADCGDLRFTDAAGNLLPYYIVSGCGSASTVVHVFLDTFPAGAQTFYYYYGNPSAANGTEASDFANAATGVTFGTAGSEEKAPSPSAYWKFDDGTGTTANDSSSNQKTGTLVGTPSWVQEDLCVSGKCLEFDGNPTNNDRVYAVNPMPTGDFTYSAWVRLNSYADPNGATIFSAESTAASGDTDEFLISADDGDNKLMVSLNASFVIFANDVITLNKWQFITVTRSGSAVTAYVDGLEVGSGTDGTALTFESTCNLYIGIDPQSGCDEAGNTFASEFDGFIDEPKVYNFALTAAQVKNDYASRGSSAAGAVLGASTENDIAALSNGLVGYWRLDEVSGNAVDSSGNAQTGTDTSTTVATGKYANGRTFNGTTSNFSMGDVLDFERTEPFTLSAWVKRASAATVEYIVAKEDNDNNAEGYEMSLLGNGTVAFILQNNQTTNSISVNGSVNVRDNAWHHILVTYDGSSKAAGVKIYTDGTLNTNTVSRDTLSATTVTAEPFLLGCRTGCTLQEYAGTMDEIRVYSRALTGADVVNLYNWTPGPIGYWNFEEGTSSTVNDRSANGDTGTWNGTLGSQWAQGKYGKAGNFNGDNNYINVTDNDVFNLDSVGQYSWSFWVNPDDFESWNNAWQQAVDSSNHFDINIHTVNDGAWGQVDNGVNVGWANGGILATVSNSDVLQVGRWDYVTVTYDGTQAAASKFKIYVNGVNQTGTTETNANSDISPTAVRIGGAEPLFTGENFDGKLDEVRVYNYLISQSQMISDMNGGHPSVGSPVGSPFIYYKFDQGYGTVAGNDGNLGIANNGTVNGALWRTNAKIGGGLDFDSNNNRVYSTVVLPTTDFTYSAWVKARRLPAASTAYYVLNAESSAASSNDELILSIDENGLMAGCTNGCTGIAADTVAMTPNKWYHFVFTRIGSTLSLYRDGKLVGTDTDATALTFAAGCNIYIGADPVTGCDESGNSFAAGWGWNGMIDEFKAYNYGLTADQVLIDYNQGKSLVLGALSDTSQLSGGSVASNSASAEYCVPGSSETCAAPVGRWSFEEGTGTTANDLSTNVNTGTLTGPTWTLGKIGKSLSFDGDGSDDRVTVSDSSSLDAGAQGTMAAWYKRDSIGAWMGIVSKGDGCGTPETNYAIEFDPSNNFDIVIGNGSTGAEHFSTSTYTDIGVWHHVSVTWNGTRVKIYHDGVLVDDLAQGAAGAANTGALYIGTFCSTFNDDFDGQIDEVRVYNYVRSAAQIAWDYNKGKPLAYWKTDECQGTTINDASGNRYTGSLTIGGSGSQTVVGTCSTPTDGTGAWYNGRVGKYNSSVSFDGTDDFIQVTGLLGEQVEISLSAWVNLTAKDTNGAQVISLGDSVGLDAANSDGIGCSGRPAGFFYGGVGGFFVLCGPTDITGTGWHHLVYTFKSNTGSANQQRFYIDGILVDSADDDFGIGYTLGTNTFIGKHADGGTAYDFNGRIDDTRVYNYTLTPAQVKLIYNQGAAVRFGPITGTP